MPTEPAIIAAAEAAPHALRWAMMTLVTIVLLFVVYVVCLLLVRAMRRNRERLARRRAEPTEYVDAWSMHQVPTDAEPLSDDDDEVGGEERPEP